MCFSLTFGAQNYRLRGRDIGKNIPDSCKKIPIAIRRRHSRDTILKSCLTLHRNGFAPELPDHMMMRKFITSLLLCLAVCLAATASPSFINMTMQSHGLSNDGVRSILVDSRGYVWVGTYMGLNRYDGTRMKSYTRRDIGIDANYVGALCEDSTGQVWIGTSRGVAVYDYSSDSFRLPCDADGHIPDGVVNHLHADGSGNVWMDITGEGIFSCNVEEGFLRFRSKWKRMYAKMTTLSNERLFVCRSADNVYIFDKRTDRMLPVDLGKDTDMFLNDELHAPVLSPGSDDVVYVTSKTHGLCRINLSRASVEVVYRWMEGQKPNHVEFVGERYIMISTTYGLLRFDVLNDEVSHFGHDPDDRFSLAENFVTCSAMDKDGRLWVGLNTRGLNRSSCGSSKFERHYVTSSGVSMSGKVVTCIDEGEDGTVWMTTERLGLLKYDPATGRIDVVKNRRLPVFLTWVCAEGDRLWLGSYEGLYRLDLSDGSLRCYDRFELEGEIVNNRVMSIHLGKGGKMLVSLVGGMYEYREEDDTFECLGTSKYGNVVDFVQTRDGMIWACTYINGVFRYDRAKGTAQGYVSSKDREDVGEMVSSPFVDDDGGIWMIGRSADIYRYDPDADRFRVFHSIDLPDLTNCSLLNALQDDRGHMWITSTVGLFDFDPERGSLNMYTVNSGLLNNSLTSVKELSSGVFLMGSADGFISFDPEDFDDDAPLASLDFSEMYIGEVPVSSHKDRDRIAGGNVNLVDEIRLTAGQNSFRFRFSTPLEDWPGTVYAQLEGYDSEPADVSSTMEMSWFNVPYGNYTLNVTGHKPVRIVIEPPFLLSGVGIAMIVLAIVFIVGTVVLILDRVEKKKHQKDIEEVKRAKEVEMVQNKMELLQTVVHEFKTPLTLMKTPLKYLHSLEGLSEDTREELQIIDNSTDYLDRLSKELLEFIRIEEYDHEAMKLQPMDIVAKLSYICFNFSETARNRNLKLDFIHSEEQIMAIVDEKAINKILNNLIHNALKYSDSYIEVEAAVKDGTVVICVRNDGAEIPPDKRIEIFKPFVRLTDDKTRYSQGFGIGLSVAKRYAELQGGSLSLSPSQKTEFQLTLALAPEPVEAEEDEPDMDMGTKQPVVLLVEDNHELSSFLQDRMKQMFNVISAESAEAALKIIAKCRVDVILTDVSMPGMGGVEFCRRLSSDFENSHIPVVVISAISNESTKIKCMENGASLYLVKPFTVEYLVSCINGILRKRMSLRASIQKESDEQDNLAGFDIEDRDVEFLRNLDAIVETHISDEDFNVRQLENELHMSHSSLNRKMNGLLNMTSVEYIRAKRLNVAAKILRRKGVIPSEVCYMVGFSTPSYFSKCFRDFFGKTPAEYAKDAEE